MLLILLFIFTYFFYSLKGMSVILSLALLYLLLNWGGLWFNDILILDFYSILLTILCLLIIVLLLLANLFLKWESNRWRLFIGCCNRLLLVLLVCFISFDFMLFYIFFELSVIPTFFLIIGWGYRVDRLQAGLYMLLYIIIGSLPLLIIILFLFQKGLRMKIINVFIAVNDILGFYWWFYILLVFIIKLPIFLFHIWLPKAHVEAPLAGSMILAGVLLKLGGYGVFKSFYFYRLDVFIYRGWIIRVRLIGAFLISLSCLTQFDLKSLIAYSSIVHIAPVLVGLLSGSWVGVLGSFYIIYAHGLCSSGLFYGLNLVYERVKTRRVVVLRGGVQITPLLAFFFFPFSR